LTFGKASQLIELYSSVKEKHKRIKLVHLKFELCRKNELSSEYLTLMKFTGNLAGWLFGSHPFGDFWKRKKRMGPN